MAFRDLLRKYSSKLQQTKKLLGEEYSFLLFDALKNIRDDSEIIGEEATEKEIINLFNGFIETNGEEGNNFTYEKVVESFKELINRRNRGPIFWNVSTSREFIKLCKKIELSEYPTAIDLYSIVFRLNCYYNDFTQFTGNNEGGVTSAITEADNGFPIVSNGDKILFFQQKQKAQKIFEQFRLTSHSPA